MKKVLVTCLAVASVIACTKSNVEFEETTEIGLKPVAHNVTKSMMTEPSFVTSESFNVWAFYKQVDPGTSIADWQKSAEKQTTYIDEKEFVNNDATTWKGKASYYWPKMGSLLFAGYYPTTIANQVEYTFNATDNKMVISNYVPNRVVNQVAGVTKTYTEDLMYANMTPASYSKNNVPLVFKHALSWITVKVKQSEAGPKIIFENVKFTNVYPQGTATIDNNPVKESEDSENLVFNGIKWVTAGTAADVPVLEEKRTIGEGDSAQEKVGYELTTQEYTLAYEPLFIPQPMTAMVITYTIESTDGSSLRETTKPYILSGLKTDDTDNWEAGKHYTYTITMGTTEILIAPEVTDWEDVDYAITPGVEAQL